MKNVSSDLVSINWANILGLGSLILQLIFWRNIQKTPF